MPATSTPFDLTELADTMTKFGAAYAAAVEKVRTERAYGFALLAVAEGHAGCAGVALATLPQDRLREVVTAAQALSGLASSLLGEPDAAAGKHTAAEEVAVPHCQSRA